jgi:hypothetical protein
MGQMKKPLKWLPLDVDSWLFGSTRLELTHAQRAIFTDLLALAAKDSGFIRANEITSYPVEQLAGLLRADVELVASTIERCIETGKLVRFSIGTLKVTNWERYQLSRQYRWQVENGQTHPEPYNDRGLSKNPPLREENSIDKAVRHADENVAFVDRKEVSRNIDIEIGRALQENADLDAELAAKERSK